MDVKALSFSYQDNPLLEDASVRLFEGEHVVLVGPNGTGKTTFLKLLSRQLKPDQGTVETLPKLSLGYLDQYATLPKAHTVMSYMAEAYAALFEKEAQMEELYVQAANAEETVQMKLLNRAATLGEELLATNFYAFKSNILKFLQGLGMDESTLQLPLEKCSGGMRAKVMLAKLLLEEHDVLLLDEPTNFLDAEHVAWLSKFLQSYSKTFVVISHDQAFLAEIATVVWALERRQIERYKGSFETYLATAQLRQEQHQKAFVTQQKFIKKTEAFIAKNIARATTTKRAQSRRKMLAKTQRIAPPLKTRTYVFAFPFSTPTGRDVLKVKHLEIGYHEPLVEPLDFILRKGEKVVITGENGIGKTTLIKTLTQQLSPLQGSYEWIDTAQVSYFAQDSDLDDRFTPFQTIHEAYPQFDRRQVFTLLAQHGLDADLALRPLKTLSGGEKTKVRLALLKHQKSNVLIMDEPTNHLDQAAKEALLDALIEYPGTLLLVSHERRFYEAVCESEISLYEAQNER